MATCAFFSHPASAEHDLARSLQRVRSCLRSGDLDAAPEIAFENIGVLVQFDDVATR